MKPKRLLAFAGMFAGVFVVAAAVHDSKTVTEEWVAPPRAAKRKNPVPANETSIALGKAVYERECLECHGADGKSSARIAKKLGQQPGDFSNPKLWEQSDGALMWKVIEGHKPMPKFKDITSDEERWPVINYIRTLAPKSPVPDQPKKDSKP